ncbi:hypothetical protein [Akkermansia sp.]|uniref:hypothetical protein n=1 Tax=Akkermansia sp. TaxID=1872421 RepID=UPI003994FC44
MPVGTQGTVFVNGNADIRNGASSVNGSIGYRYDFKKSGQIREMVKHRFCCKTTRPPGVNRAALLTVAK